MLDVNGANSNEFLEYKGRPLVRQGDDIYYGDMSDKFYLFLMIMSYKKDAKLGVEIPDKVMVQIVSTDGSNKVEKNTMVDGLYAAFDLGAAWLERANRV